MTTVSVELPEETLTLFLNYANSKGMSLSDLVCSSILEQLEEEADLKRYQQAMEEYKENPVSYSHEDVKKMLEDLP